MTEAERLGAETDETSETPAETPSETDASDETPPEADAPAETEEEERVRLEAELAELRTELESTQKSLLRLQADFSNYRRRVAAEQKRWQEEAVGDFATEILPVLDNLERALDARKKGGDLDAFYEGVELIHRQFLDTLRRFDIEPIPAVGTPFDPRVHEAVQQVETDQVPEDHVFAEVRRGYKQKERVLRPSLVQVARAPAHSEAASQGEEPMIAEEGNDDGESGGN